jgi:hypothetical protein
LRAVQLLSVLRDALGLEITLGELFAHPSVRELVAHINRHCAAQFTWRQIPAGARPRAMTLTQKRTWFLDQFEPGVSPYNYGYLLKFPAEIAVSAFESALTYLTGIHEPLRAIYPSHEGQPVQFILPPGRVCPEVVDLSDLGEESAIERIRGLATQVARRTHIVEAPLLITVHPRLSNGC